MPAPRYGPAAARRPRGARAYGGGEDGKEKQPRETKDTALLFHMETGTFDTPADLCPSGLVEWLADEARGHLRNRAQQLQRRAGEGKQQTSSRGEDTA